MLPFAHEKRGSWGFVVRDENGQTVLAGEGNLNAVQDALCPEAEACLAAPTATMNRGMSNIVFELDSPQISMIKAEEVLCLGRRELSEIVLCCCSY